MIEKAVLKSFTGKNTVVTGGSGLIGRQVVTLLCDASAHVRVVFSDRIKVDIKANNVYGNLTRMT